MTSVIVVFLQCRSTSWLLAMSTQICITSLVPQASSFVSYSIRHPGEGRGRIFWMGCLTRTVHHMIGWGWHSWWISCHISQRHNKSRRQSHWVQQWKRYMGINQETHGNQSHVNVCSLRHYHPASPVETALQIPAFGSRSFTPDHYTDWGAQGMDCLCQWPTMYASDWGEICTHFRIII